MNVYRKLVTFYQLSQADKKLLTKSVGLLFLLKILLKLIPVNRIYSAIKALHKEPYYTYTDFLGFTEKVVWSVEKTGNLVVKSQCLAKALAVHFLLNQKRIANTLEIGFVQEKNKLSAHAWIRAEEKILIGDTTNLKFYFRVLIQ